MSLDALSFTLNELYVRLTRNWFYLKQYCAVPEIGSRNKTCSLQFSFPQVVFDSASVKFLGGQCHFYAVLRFNVALSRPVPIR